MRVALQRTYLVLLKAPKVTLPLPRRLPKLRPLMVTRTPGLAEARERRVMRGRAALRARRCRDRASDADRGDQVGKTLSETPDCVRVAGVAMLSPSAALAIGTAAASRQSDVTTSAATSTARVPK